MPALTGASGRRIDVGLTWPPWQRLTGHLCQDVRTWVSEPLFRGSNPTARSAFQLGYPVNHTNHRSHLSSPLKRQRSQQRQDCGQLKKLQLLSKPNAVLMDGSRNKYSRAGDQYTRPAGPRFGSIEREFRAHRTLRPMDGQATAEVKGAVGSHVILAVLYLRASGPGPGSSVGRAPTENRVSVVQFRPWPPLRSARSSTVGEPAVPEQARTPSAKVARPAQRLMLTRPNRVVI